MTLAAVIYLDQPARFSNQTSLPCFADIGATARDACTSILTDLHSEKQLRCSIPSESNWGILCTTTTRGLLGLHTPNLSAIQHFRSKHFPPTFWGAGHPNLSAAQHFGLSLRPWTFWGAHHPILCAWLTRGRSRVALQGEPPYSDPRLTASNLRRLPRHLNPLGPVH